MITTINEFKFSNHYVKDDDNRFEYRVKNAKIKNTDLKDIDKANKRFKAVLYYHSLETLHNMQKPGSMIGVVFGNTYFREDGRIKPAIIEVDKERNGNVYVAIVKEQTVTTMLLVPMSKSNADIIKQMKDHEKRVSKEKMTKPAIYKGLYNLNGDKLEETGNKRKPLIIDLDIKDEDFNKQYPYPILPANVLNDIRGLSDFYKDEVSKMKPREDTRIVYHPVSEKMPLAEKEFVIARDSEILFKKNKDSEPELKTIREIYVTEYGNRVKYEIELVGSLTRYELKRGMTFIISPAVENKQKRELMDMFNLEDGENISFSGPIVRFAPYPKGKGGSDRFKLGVVIKPLYVL